MRLAEIGGRDKLAASRRLKNLVIAWNCDIWAIDCKKHCLIAPWLVDIMNLCRLLPEVAIS